MNNFKLIQPNVTHESVAIEFAQEYVNASDTMIPGYLRDYLDDFHGWLELLEENKNCEVDKDDVPEETFFFVGSEPDGLERIIGICTIRYALNSDLWRSGGHVAFSIRPTERGHGYAKIMLYLILCVCEKHHIGAILISCTTKNVAAATAVQHLGGELLACYTTRFFDTKQKFVILVKNSINDYRLAYELQLAAENCRIPE